MNLTSSFSFSEACNTSHADLEAMNRIQGSTYIPNMRDLAVNVLEKIRAKYGPFTISSWFRGPELNRAVGGSPTSQHCKGQAADIFRSDWDWETLDGVANWIKKESGIVFGQVIRERDGRRVWLHVSTGTKCEALDRDGRGAKYTARA